MVMVKYIQEQQLPSVLKKGLITPLYKADDPLNLSN